MLAGLHLAKDGPARARLDPVRAVVTESEPVAQVSDGAVEHADGKALLVLAAHPRRIHQRQHARTRRRELLQLGDGVDDLGAPSTELLIADGSAAARGRSPEDPQLAP